LRKLSDTIARLSTLRAYQRFHGDIGGAAGQLADLPSFGSNPGALRARVFIPTSLPAGAPLVVVLHGCTQTAAAYDYGSGWSRLAEQEGFAVLFPEQSRANNANLCFNWFEPGDMRRNLGEVLSIYQMIDTLIARHSLDRRRVFVTGLSAGGAMAAAMLAAYPEVFAGGAIIAGLAYGSARTIPEAFDRMRGHGGPSEKGLQQLLRNASSHNGPWPTISIWQGSADHTVVPANADAIAGQWRHVHGVATAPTRSEFVDGHLREVWCDPTGDARIERYTIAGMGHGTPLMTKGVQGLGAAGPFMLDVGISSTRRIAHFWGIAGLERDAVTAIERKFHPDRHSEMGLPHVGAPPIEPAPNASDRAAAAVLSHPPDSNGVRKIIEDALRAAGLM
jgi:poly(hydroxyalkanoate) depolymerase family esterase